MQAAPEPPKVPEPPKARSHGATERRSDEVMENDEYDVQTEDR